MVQNKCRMGCGELLGIVENICFAKSIQVKKIIILSFTRKLSGYMSLVVKMNKNNE